MAEVTAADINVITDHGRSPVEPQRGQGPTVSPVSSGTSFQRQERFSGIMGLPATSEDKSALVGNLRPPEKGTIRAEVETSIEDFAISYTQKLINMKNNLTINVGGVDVNVYDAMKQQMTGIGMQYLEDDALLTSFTEEKNGKLQLKSLDEIRTIIANHSSVQESIMLVAERYARDTLAALGLRAEMIRPGSRTYAEDMPGTINFPTDQGSWRRVLNGLSDALRKRESSGGRTGPRSTLESAIDGLIVSAGTGGSFGALAGGVIGNIPGAAVGGVAGTAIAAGIGRESRRGPRLRLVEDLEVGAAANRNGENLRAKYLLGVDTANFDLSLRPGDAKNDAIGIIMLRWQYLTDMGVRPERMDALSSDFIGVGGRKEETGYVLLENINTEFERAGGQAPGLTPTQRMDIFRRAQRKAIIEGFNEYFSPQRDRTSELNGAIEARRDGGTSLQNRRKDAEAEQQRLQAEKTKISETGGKLTRYRERASLTQTTEQALQDTLSRIIQGGAALGYDHALAALRQSLTVAGAADIDIPDQDGSSTTIHDLVGEDRRIKTDRQNAINGIAPRQAGESEKTYNLRYEDARGMIIDRYSPQLEEIERQRRLVSSAVETLISQKRAADGAGREALSAQEINAGREEVTGLNRAYDRVRGVGLSEDDLINEDIVDILTDANSMFDQGNNYGWPEADNKVMRDVIRLARIQARANQLTRAGFRRTGTVEVRYNNVVSHGITNEQLRILKLDELEKLPSSRGVGGRTALRDAQTWAQVQMQVYQEAVNQELGNIEESEEIQARRLRSVDLDAEIAQLTMIRDMYVGRRPIREKASKAYFTNGDILADFNHVTANVEGYTHAEELSALPRNVLEMLNYLTNYQSSPDRGAAFQQVWKNLNSDPNLILPILKKSFNLPAAVNIDDFANELALEIGNHSLEGSEFGRALGTGVIRRLVDYGLSLGI